MTNTRGQLTSVSPYSVKRESIRVYIKLDCIPRIRRIAQRKIFMTSLSMCTAIIWKTKTKQTIMGICETSPLPALWTFPWVNSLYFLPSSPLPTFSNSCQIDRTITCLMDMLLLQLYSAYTTSYQTDGFHALIKILNLFIYF